MKQVIKKNKTNSNKEKKKIINQHKKASIKTHPKYGTSKLEEDFARDFLDKLGLEYEYQFEAKGIGRFFDYRIGQTLIEIDGDYFHSNPLIYEEKDLNRMQKRNKKIDEYKNTWALTHGFPIIRIWETDIRKHPDKVMKILVEHFMVNDEQKKITNTIPKRKQIKKR